MRSLIRSSFALLFLATAVTAADTTGPVDLSQSSVCCDELTCDDGCDSCCVADSDCDRSCSLCDSFDRDCCCCPRPCTYWSLFGGWSQINSYNGNLPGPVTQVGDFNDGWALGIARGRRFGNGLRGELEFSYRRFGADIWSVNGVPSNWNGHLNTYFGMANLYRDWDNWQFAGLTPYIGGGIGLAIIDGSFNTAAASQEIQDAAFAYQAMAGFTKRISCSVDAFVEYRYVGTTETQLDRTDTVTDTRLGQYPASIDNVMFGIRIWR